MIKPTTCFVAESIITDKVSDQLSAIGLAETLTGASFPLSVPKIAFFVLWQRERDDPSFTQAEFSVDLGGDTLVRQTVDINFAESLRHRITLKLSGFVIPATGSVRFQLAVPGHGAAEYLVPAELSGGA